MDVIDLRHVDRSSAGGKAAPLADLLRSGFVVPPGFVLPYDTYRTMLPTLGLDDFPLDNAAEARRRVLGTRLSRSLRNAVADALAALTDGAATDYVAVRSSSNTEDQQSASAAGQHDTVLAVRGVDQVCRAILRCWASLWTDRALAYRDLATRQAPEPEMAVLVQRFIDPEASGVMFTGSSSTIEATWGLGEPLVKGHVTPDQWRIEANRITTRRISRKSSRTDRQADHIITSAVPEPKQEMPCLDDNQILELHRLGRRLAATTGDATDVEWAIDGDTTWVLQARPVTAALPETRSAPRPRADTETVLAGEPASTGVATGTARVVRGPRDFATVRPGDVLVCQVTDPAWTPLFSIASAVVTETGGVLSHAAIVAREVGLPAVLSVARATQHLAQTPTVTVDGRSGLVHVHNAERTTRGGR